MIGIIGIALAVGAADLPNLAWLEGQWCTTVEQARQTCEDWGPARGGTMLGTGQTLRDGRTHSFEYMRIELADGAAVLYASPRGAPAVPFRETGRTAQGISFANPDRDYPQRVRYWRRGEALIAEVALNDGSRPRRWVYRRMR